MLVIWIVSLARNSSRNTNTSFHKLILIEFYKWQILYSGITIRPNYSPHAYISSEKAGTISKLSLTDSSSAYNDSMRLSSTIQFIHLIVSIQSLPIYRMIKYNTFLFWTLNQTRLVQFGSSISHKFLIFILNIDHTKDWNMLAKPIWVVMKWWKRVNRWLDPKSMTREWW